MDTLSASAVLAQGQPAPGSNWGLNLVPIVLIFGIFLFLVILPAQRQRKRHQKMVDSLKNGDKVVTNGGLMGTVAGVKGNVVQLRVADNVRIEVLKNYIAGHQAGEEEASKE